MLLNLQPLETLSVFSILHDVASRYHLVTVASLSRHLILVQWSAEIEETGLLRRIDADGGVEYTKRTTLYATQWTVYYWENIT